MRAACDRTLEPDDSINELGVDVARFGEDSTVVYHRRGGVVRHFASVAKRDLMEVCGLVVNALRATQATRVKVDEAGLGGGVVDRLNEICANDSDRAGGRQYRSFEDRLISAGAEEGESLRQSCTTLAERVRMSWVPGRRSLRRHARCAAFVPV